MRLLSIALLTAPLALAATAAIGTAAHAQSYPWCLQSSAFEGGENCGFTTFDQCMATRLGVGGFCQRNTQYQASMPAPMTHSRSH